MANAFPPPPRAAAQLRLVCGFFLAFTSLLRSHFHFVLVLTSLVRVHSIFLSFICDEKDGELTIRSLIFILIKKSGKCEYGEVLLLLHCELFTFLSSLSTLTVRNRVAAAKLKLWLLSVWKCLIWWTISTRRGALNAFPACFSFAH